MSNGEGGGILGILDSLLGFLFGTNQPDSRPFQATTGIGNYAFNTLRGSLSFLGDVVQSLKGIFDTVWNNIIKVVLVRILEAYSRLRQLLQRIFGPVVRFLHRLRQIYDSYYKQFVRPMLRVIQHIRQFLKILRALGFKWAGRLDARLGKIENRIIGVWTLLRQHLNQVISWLDLVIDPTFLLRRNALFGSLIRSAPELRNLLLAVPLRDLTDDEKAQQDSIRSRLTPSIQKANYQNYYSQGVLPPDMAQWRANTQTQLAAIMAGQGDALGE